MTYESIDALQNALAKNVFHYTRDSKKASGRALGTLVEIITFYLLKTWGYEKRTAIERRIPEYANPDLTHNVEFTLHPVRSLAEIELEESDLPFTAKKIMRMIGKNIRNDKAIKTNQLLSKTKILRNSCTIYESANKFIVAYLGDKTGNKWKISVKEFQVHPFAMFECKRVGVEEGTKKGPQTIEKAKQGAYVAKSVSSLQKIRKGDGSVYGVLPTDNNRLSVRPYSEFIQTIVDSNESSLLKDFVLTVGVVSNHGNWFTSDNHNKELKVLAQSYDWLLFLSDKGLCRFIEDLILKPQRFYQNAQTAFMGSYSGSKSIKNQNKFTKVVMNLSASQSIQRYFQDNLLEIETWFNTISPMGLSISDLKKDIQTLTDKNWLRILA